MNRFDYLHAPARAPLRLGSAAFAVDNRIRGPLLALSLTLALTVGAGIIQLERLHAVGRAYERAAIALTATEPAVRDVAALRERVARTAQLCDEIDSIRRSGLQRANEFAWIGNQLPAHTWLRALRYEDGVYSLEGTAEYASAVGAAILALRDADRATLPQLVALNADPNAGAARIHYRLRITSAR